MFDSLADQIRQDVKEQTNSRQEIIRWTAIAVLVRIVDPRFLGGFQELVRRVRRVPCGSLHR